MTLCVSIRSGKSWRRSRPSVISVGACQSHTVRGTNTHSVDLGLEAIGPVLYHALFEPSGKLTFQRKEEQREPVLKYSYETPTIRSSAFHRVWSFGCLVCLTITRTCEAKWRQIDRSGSGRLQSARRNDSQQFEDRVSRLKSWIRLNHTGRYYGIKLWKYCGNFRRRLLSERGETRSLQSVWRNDS